MWKAIVSKCNRQRTLQPVAHKLTTLKWVGRITTIGLVLLLSACSSDDDPQLSTTDRLQAIIDDKIESGSEGLVGVSVSIRVEGEERWNLTGGISTSDVPISADMQFGIGSITKTAVAAATLKLVDEELLSLDDTVDDILGINTFNIDGSITVFQLLAHFAGVRGYFQHPDIWPRVEGNLEESIPADDLLNYIGEPINAPGSLYQYSNSHYLLLGLIIEEVSGQTVGEVLRDRFWAPLQLENIHFGANETVAGPIAGAWRDSDGDGVLEDITNEFGPAYHSVFYCAAGIFSTASDLSLWAYHLYGGEVLSQQSRSQMMTSYIEIPDPVFTGYGLGARRNVYAGWTMWGHTGGMRGYGSAMFYDPNQKVSIAMLNNQSRSVNGPQLRQELVEELLTVVFESL